jgi:hypothetical protein
MKKLLFYLVLMVFGIAGVASASRTNPVPEPATMLLLGSGLIVIAGFGRKKIVQKKKKADKKAIVS